MAISKKERLARSLKRSGVLALLETFARRQTLIVLNYHRIGSVHENRFDDGVFSATAEEFEQQLMHVRRRYHLLGRDDLDALAHGELQVRRPAVLITFDDGYKDNRDLAVPILSRHEASALFFIPTGYIDEPRLPWWDHIAYVIKTTRAETLQLDQPQTLRLDLTTLTPQAAVLEILRVFKTAESMDEQGFLRHLEERAEVAVDRPALGRQLFMSWAEVRELMEAGMMVGSHTHSHQILARLPVQEQMQELTRSKQRLEEQLGGTVETISYPVGKPYTYSADTKRLAREAGYRMGFSFHGGVNVPGQIDPFDVKRIGVERENSLARIQTRLVRSALFARA